MSTVFSIAFYNLENLFDSEHNEYTLDKDFTPEGVFQWNRDRYLRKIQNLGNAISKIGHKKAMIPPIFLGVAEVENKTCLEDLIHSEKLQTHDYDFVHYDSPDERGVGVAFLYQKEHFELTYSDTYTLYITDHEDNRDFTRDILLISGKLFSEEIYVIINHWPSRNSGKKASEAKRIKAAKLVREIVEEIYRENKDPKIIIMGDFNDQPNSTSIRNYLVTDDFFNPMLSLQENKKGSINYMGKWYLFDQIIFSNPFLKDFSRHNFYKDIAVFDDHFLQEATGKRKGSPKRTFLGKYHLGGFSDHFPVVAYLEK